MSALGLFLLASPLLAAPRFAVVVGLNDYEHLAPLRAGVSDSQSLADHYRELGYDQVFLLNDQAENGLYSPSINHLLQVMDAVEALAQRESPQELVFSFAGHGVQQEGTNYLCLADADLESRRGLLDVDGQLIPWLRRLRPNLALVFLDACRQTTVVSRGVGWTRGIAIETDRPSGAPDPTPQTAVFYATQPGGTSYETPDGSHGLFTQTLLEGLRQPTRNRLGLLRDYLEETLPLKTLEAYGKTQLPSVGGEFHPETEFSSYQGDTGRATFGGRGELLVQTTPPRAEVFANGIRLGIAPILLTGLQAKRLRVTAQTTELFAEEEVVVKTTGLQTLHIGLSERRGRLFIQTDDDALRVSVDQAAFVPVLDHLVPALPVGQRHVRLVSDRGYYETRLEVVNNATLTVTPVWAPYGSLSLRLPEGGQLLLNSTATGQQRALSRALKKELMPVGDYEAIILAPDFQPWHGLITVRTSEDSFLEPPLEPTVTARWQKDLSLRTHLDVATGVLATGTLASLAAGAWFWNQQETLQQEYQTAGPEADFAGLRARIRASTGAFAASLTLAAIQATAAALCQWLGPHPQETAP